jgi:hypothetical protein
LLALGCRQRYRSRARAVPFSLFRRRQAMSRKKAELFSLLMAVLTD